MEVVKRVSQYLIFVSLLGGFSSAFCQTAASVNLNARIMLNRDRGSFGSYLDEVSKQTGVVFSFSSKKISSEKILDLSGGNQTLEVFLKQIRQKTGLFYKIVGTHIIFLEQPPAKPTEKAGSGTQASALKSNAKSTISKKQTVKHTDVRQKMAGSERSSTSNNKQAPSQADSVSQMTATNSAVRTSDQEKISNKESQSDSVSTLLARKNISKQADSAQTRVADSAKRVPKERISTASVASSTRVRRSNRATGKESSDMKWFLGGQVSFISGTGNKSESLRATGLGLNVKMEGRFGQRFAYTASIGFDHFTGKFIHPVYSGPPGDSIINRFTIAPVLVGMKYYIANSFYVSGELGPALKASTVTRTKLALAPSAGFTIPLQNNSAIDFSVKFTHIVSGYGLLESTSLQNGGYSFLSIRAAYGLSF